MGKLHAILIVLALGGGAGQVADQVATRDATGSDGSAQDRATGDGVMCGATDDLFAGDMPDLLVDAHARQLGGELLEIEIQRELYDYAVASGDDARPWLLLARDSMRRDWEGFAVRQYASAIETDPCAATQPGVLDDLIAVAATHGGSLERREASALITAAYGTRALPALDRAMSTAEASGDHTAIERLAALQETTSR